MRRHSIKIIREVHETPEWAAETLRRLGGLNRFGEPMLRVVWGWNCLTPIGGKFTERDSSGNVIRETCVLRNEPKYPTYLNRWIIEQWFAPETFGSPESWYRSTKEWGEEGNIPQLGPYPHRGRYGLFTVLENERGGFLQLTHWLLGIAARHYWWLKRHPVTLAEEKEIQRKREEAWEREAAEIVADGKPAFHYNEFVTVL